MSEVKTNKITSLASNNDITLDPDGTGDVVVASGHKLGVGTTSPASDLHVVTSDFKAAQFEGPRPTLFFKETDGSADENYQIRVNGGDLLFQSQNDAQSSAVDRMTIDSSGKVGIGTSSPSNTFQVNGDGARLVNSSDTDALHLFEYNGSNHAEIALYDAGGNNTVKLSTSAVSFFTGQALLVGKSSTTYTGTGCVFARNSNSFFGADTSVPLLINRNNNDGTLMQFRQADTTEGTITVSGTTVSFNGGHLARFSRLTDGSRPSTLLKGTVMSNLDEMIVWSHDDLLWTEDDELPDGVSVGDVRRAAHTEDNEQLNHTKVSDTEGDIDVAGVFVAWDDDDDDFEDFHLAMTGDMVIRIASGTTVARGDLLMSAGDGTAKPQGDDIVRSKTIAKVTSTTKSHTYDDGSYLVPCVLMAC